jgi:hypothetical protein
VETDDHPKIKRSSHYMSVLSGLLKVGLDAAMSFPRLQCDMSRSGDARTFHSRRTAANGMIRRRKLMRTTQTG